MAQTYKYVIVGDTKQAVQSNEVLDASINKVDASTKQLSADTKKLGADTQKAGIDAQKAFSAELETKIKATDARIKTISGTIGVFTGTLSTAVGALGLFGIDDEQIAGFQKSVLSVLALGQGTAQAITGFKDLTEAKKLQNEVTIANTLAEDANTVALNNNASAATNITSATGAAQASITQESAATVLNTLSKEQNRLVVIASAKAVKDLNDEEIDLLSTKLRSIGTTEADIAAQLADARSKGVNTTATQALAGQTNTLTTSQTLLNKALKAAPWIAVATLVASVIGVISTYANKFKEATKNTLEFDKELAPVLAKAATSEERLLKVLTDNVRQRGLEKQAIDELKKTYPGFEAFLTRENQLNERGIAFLKARIELRRAEAGLSAVAEKRIQEEVDLAQKIADLRIEYGFTTQAAKLIDRARDESAERTAFLTEKETEYSNAVNQALLNLAPFNKELSKYAKDNAPASIDATDKQAISLQSYNLAVQSFIDKQKERNKLIAEEVRLSLDVEGSIKKSNEGFIKRASTIPSIVNTTAEETKKTYATQALEFEAFIEQLQTDLISFLESGAGQAIKQGLSTLSGLLSEFGNLQQEAIDIELARIQRRYQREIELAGENAQLKEQITKDFEARELEIQKTALEQQKNLRRAQVIVTTADSVISAYASTASIPPPFGLIAGSLLAAAYIGLGAKAIDNINATNLEGGGAIGSGFQNIPSGGGFSLPGGAGIPTGGPLPGLGGGRVTTPSIGTIAQEPIRAYVLAGDVTNGVQANIALNNRRRLAG